MFTVRLPTELLDAAREIAQARGETLSQVVRRLLRDHVAEARASDRASGAGKLRRSLSPKVRR